MAGKDINIPITGDARDFIRKTGDVGDALDDVADALDDVARDTKRGAKESERAVEKLEDSFKDAAKRARDLGDAGDKAGDDVKRGMRKAEDGVDEFKEEANSTAREAAASFDGSAESIGDALQEVAANAFAGFGPAGAVAGLAAAAGIGLAIAGFDAVNEASEESKQRAAEWADAYIEAGSRTLTFEQQAAKVRDILTDPEKYQTASDNAKNWGVTVDTAVAAMTGSASALDEVNGNLADSSKRIADEMADVGIQFDWTGESMVDLSTRTAAGQRAFDMLTGEMERGSQAADVMSRWLTDTARATEGATEAVDEFGDTVITLPDGHQVYIDAETGQATANVDQIEQKIYGIPDGSATVDVDTSQAQADLDRWVVQNNGRTIKINGRVTVDSGVPFE